MLFLVMLLLPVLSVPRAKAGIIFHETPHGAATINNVHSPAAYSHQSITHILSDTEARILASPQHAASSSSSSVITAQPSAKIAFPHTTESKQLDRLRVVTQRKVNSAAGSLSSADAFISYKDTTPVLNSATHTPAHLTYAANPVIYQKLPMIVPAPYISYNAFKSGHTN